jgi:hypothetical protein
MAVGTDRIVRRSGEFAGTALIFLPDIFERQISGGTHSAFLDDRTRLAVDGQRRSEFSLLWRV